jgi:hypothetical protein
MKKRILFLLSLSLMFSCSLSEEDFSDIRIIENIIKEDKEQIFGVELTAESEPSAADSQQIVFKNSMTISGSNYFVEGSISKNGFGTKFGRIVTTRIRDIFVNLVTDSLAYVEARYTIEGYFKVIYPNNSAKVIKMSQELKRLVTMERRESETTQERWRRVNITAAYGTSPDSNIVPDSVIICTPHDTIKAGDPFDINILENGMLTLNRGDSVTIAVKAFNRTKPSDPLIGIVKNGKNRFAGYRDKKFMFRTGENYYIRKIYIGYGQEPGFNQLTIDFYNRQTIYDYYYPKYESFLILIPYRVAN